MSTKVEPFTNGNCQTDWAQTTTVLDPTNWGMTALSNHESESSIESKKINVPIEDGGEYLKSVGCKDSSLIKEDVEGHRPTVPAWLRG